MHGDFQIGSWLIQPALNDISSNGKTAHVEPKAMRVLVELANQAGEVVGKETLIRSVWFDTFVTDDVLTRAISELRKAFGDNSRDPRIIQTIPKGGYRLIACVEGSARSSLNQGWKAQGPAAGNGRPQDQRRSLPAAAGITLATIGLILTFNLAGLRDRLMTAAGFR